MGLVLCLKEELYDRNLYKQFFFYEKKKSESEKKIKASGYPRAISGADVYDDICDQIEGKENGEYILLSKFDEDVVFEYHITIQDENFNLGILTMKTPDGVYQADFDEE